MQVQTLIRFKKYCWWEEWVPARLQCAQLSSPTTLRETHTKSHLQWMLTSQESDSWGTLYCPFGIVVVRTCSWSSISNHSANTSSRTLKSWSLCLMWHLKTFRGIFNTTRHVWVRCKIYLSRLRSSVSFTRWTCSWKVNARLSLTRRGTKLWKSQSMNSGKSVSASKRAFGMKPYIKPGHKLLVFCCQMKLS